MIYTIGAGVGADFSIEDANYDKIIIMTDADTDGVPHSNTSLNLLLPLYASSCRDRTCLYRPPASLQDVKR